MERVTYILDTTVVTDGIRRDSQILDRLTRARENGHTLGLCDPVRYEVLRGLFKVNATRKLQLFRQTIMPLLDHVPLIEADWRLAAGFWANLRNRGVQLSDVDLLIAAITQRLDGVVVTADNDFAALPIQRENWRLSPSPRQRSKPR